MAALEPVEGEGGVGFFGEVEDIGDFHLHAEGGFEGAEASFEDGVAGVLGEVGAVEGGEGGEFALLLRDGDARGDVSDGFRAGDDERALMGGGEEVGGPDLGAGVGGFGGEDDEGGEVGVFGAEAVADP